MASQESIAAQAGTSQSYCDWTPSGVNPDVVPSNPATLLKVTYGGRDVTPGEILTAADTKREPQLQWALQAPAAGTITQLYTVLMVDPDAPSRKDPKYRNWLHWGVVNVTDPASLAQGFQLADGYMGPAPPPKTGLHRYVFLVYAQRGVLDASSLSVVKDGKDGMGRGGWDLKSFLNTHQHLIDGGVPIAGNFFQCQNEVQ